MHVFHPLEIQQQRSTVTAFKLILIFCLIRAFKCKIRMIFLLLLIPVQTVGAITRQFKSHFLKPFLYQAFLYPFGLPGGGLHEHELWQDIRDIIERLKNVKLVT